MKSILAILITDCKIQRAKIYNPMHDSSFNLRAAKLLEMLTIF
jgi:hypothetical protein